MKREDWPPLHRAAQGKDSDLVRSLIEAGADVNESLPNGYTPLHLAVRSQSPLAVVQALIDAGADVNAVCHTEGVWIPLHVAAFNEGYLDVVKALIEAGSDLEAKDDDGMTALDIALDRASTDSVEAQSILASGVRTGKTLDAAISREASKSDIVRELIQAGAQPGLYTSYLIRV